MFDKKPKASNTVATTGTFAKGPKQSNVGGGARRPIKELQLITNQFELVFKNKYLIHNYSLQLQYVEPKKKRLDDEGNEIRTWRPTQSVLDRKVKDVVTKVESQLKEIFINFVWSGTNLYSMTHINTDDEGKIIIQCEL